MANPSLSPIMRANAWWLVPVLASCALFTVVTRGRVDLRTDSIYYLSCAETLLHRHELGAGVYFSERIARASNGERIEGLRKWPRQPAEPGEIDGRPPAFASYTAWPPGFPVFLAAFLGALPSTTAAAFAAMLTSYALVALGAALLGRALGGSSFGMGALAVVASPYLFDAGTCFLGSDVLCTALVLMALAALVSWMRAPSAPALVAAVACTVAAAYVRYLALLVMPVIVALVAVAAWRGKLVGSAARMQLAIAVVPAPLAMSPLLLRNLRETGYLFGTERLPSDRGLIGNVEDVARATLRTLPLSFDAVPGKLDLAVSGAILLLFVVLVATYVRSERALAPEPTEARALLPVLLFAAFYVAALVVVRTRTLADELEARLLLPALVSLTIAGLVLGARLVRQSARVRVGAALVALLATATLSEVPAQQARVAARAERAEARAVELRALLGDRTSQGVPALLFSDRAFEVSTAIGGGTVHWLPAPSHVPAIEAQAQGRPMAFVLQRSSSFFPCSAMESAYEQWLARSARETKRGEIFEVYWLAAGGGAASAVEEACDGLAAE
jgi:hypothetical protein